MLFNKLGTLPNDEGGFSYDSYKNPLLVNNIWGNNFWVARPAHMNPATFASFSAASAVASALRGKVVADPMAGAWNLLTLGPNGFTPYPRDAVYAVELSNGRKINAGYICDAMGNDVAFPTADAKSEAICRDNQLPMDLGLAEKIWNALKID